MRALLRFFVLGLTCICLDARQVTITLLATTDLHGNILPWDYLTGKPAARGLAKLATLIQAERAKNPNNLLIDCGDTIQGTPLEATYQNYIRTGTLPDGVELPANLPGDPMMLVMNYLKYDAMVVGNHEYNYGLKNLARARADAHFPWLSANTATITGPGKPFATHIIKTIDGIKVAVIGVTTPGIPSWEKPENYSGRRFLAVAEAVRQTLDEIRRTHHPDLVIVAAHAGLDRDPATGALRAHEAKGDNPVYEVATGIPGIDAIVYGHTHLEVPELRLSTVLLMQPKNWGISLGRMELVLENGTGSKWKVVHKTSTVIPVTHDTPADSEIVRMAQPYHQLAEQALRQPLTQSSTSLSANASRIEDTAIIDAIHLVQLHYAKADVSFASSFNPRATIPKGAVTARQLAGIYLYDNELYAIEGNGKIVREALENAARFYLGCPNSECKTNHLINRAVLPYNFDMAAGLNYEIDLTKPEGQRITNLMFRDKPLRDDQPLRIAVNNYRAGGSAGYEMFKNAKVVWRSNDDIRSLMMRYYSEGHPFPSEADHNWRIIPEPAHRILKEEILLQNQRYGSQ
ncbi:MAG TPA: 5'-nucleotidase C-terminal domain-containing protein [Bryobacteraceae bacterium]|nr:5'-nucleotidase C-terminal domain-containing protein [Bryobacteraceae bacterium]